MAARVSDPKDRPIDPAKRTRRGRPAYRMSSAGKGDVVLKCQSGLEWLFAMAAVIHPQVSEIFFQPMVINLTTGEISKKKIKLDPKCKYYIPDYLLVINGKEWVIEVKAHALLKMSKKDYEQIRLLLLKNGKRFVILTDLDLSSAEKNIKILYEYSVHSDQEMITSWANNLEQVLDRVPSGAIAKDISKWLVPANWYVCAGIIKGSISFDMFRDDLMAMDFGLERACGDLSHLEAMHFE